MCQQFITIIQFLTSSNEHEACTKRDRRISQNISLSLGYCFINNKENALITKKLLTKTKYQGEAVYRGKNREII